ncbi:hypothetical protein [Streptosporangium sp. NPDC002524]|uniref:hypothetical protein n=1 Tax=Streptosporangium sp. NPDC002524 TaxID=3154537 RepID=UPI0033221AAE
MCAVPSAAVKPLAEKQSDGRSGDARSGGRLSALCRAAELAALLNDVHGISADVHELRSGKAVVSVYYGLMAYTDGERFWWTGPERGHSSGLLPFSETEPGLAAERLAGHYATLRARPVVTLLGGELPLLADVMLAEHVVPR